MARLDAGEIEVDIQRPHARGRGGGAPGCKECAGQPLGGAPAPSGNAAPVPMDGERIREVLTQLLDNAAKYSPSGSPIVISSDVRTDFLSPAWPTAGQVSTPLSRLLSSTSSTAAEVSVITCRALLLLGVSSSRNLFNIILNSNIMVKLLLSKEI